MSKDKKPRPTFGRHSDELRKKIVAFLKSGKTNQEAKAAFGVSAHFAGKLRKENKLAPAAPAKAPAAPAKGAKAAKAPAKAPAAPAAPAKGAKAAKAPAKAPAAPADTADVL